MTEREARLSPEREVKPISIELTTKRDQEAMIEIADRALRAGTLEELRGGGGNVRIENNVWRPIFRRLANNLGIRYEQKELLMRGIIDDIPLQTLEQWARGGGQQSPGEKAAMTTYAKYFLKQKRKIRTKGQRK